MKIGILHPGAMGITVAATLRASGHLVYWTSEGRSRATQERATDLDEVPTLSDLVKEVDHLISVCPPDAAVATAEAVLERGFRGTYIDANAIAPATARQIADRVGANYVDGGLIGPPAVQPGTTRLYLSGPESLRVSEWFRGGPLAAISIGEDVAIASALKMCYAAFTKGQIALLLAVRALAEREGVADALASEWDLSQRGLNARAQGAARGTAPKAWRFEGEMAEIARTFSDAGLPDGFHRAAGEVYRRMSGLKAVDSVKLGDVIDALLTETTDASSGQAAPPSRAKRT